MYGKVRHRFTSSSYVFSHHKKSYVDSWQIINCGEILSILAECIRRANKFLEHLASIVKISTIHVIDFIQNLVSDSNF